MWRKICRRKLSDLTYPPCGFNEYDNNTNGHDSNKNCNDNNNDHNNNGNTDNKQYKLAGNMWESLL